MRRSCSSITLLPEPLQNQIAAGEVVERPASVIKELVENSLDAEATTIEVMMENGGHTFIQVRDNGIGIPANELTLALTRHATSKIRMMEDLWKIQSFGFRGEALPSIASVSSFKIESAYAKDDGLTEAAFLQVEHGKIEKEGPSSLYQGTIITVQDLFATVPARLKFLKTPTTEQKRAQDLFSRLALTTEAEMILYSGTRELVKFSQGLSLPQRLNIIWPESITSNLLSFDKTSYGIRVHGFTSPPNQTQPRADRILLYVNGRALNDKLLLRAVRDAYKGRLISKEYPQSILFIEIPPEYIDINVHPAKTEVRFRDEKTLFSAVLNALKEPLTKIHPNFSLHQTDVDTHPKGFWGEADYQRTLPINQPIEQYSGLEHESVKHKIPTNQTTPVCTQSSFLAEPLISLSEVSVLHSMNNNTPVQQKPTEYVQKNNQSTCMNPPSESSLKKDSDIPIAQGISQLHIGPYIYMGQVGDTYLLLIDTREKNEKAALIILDQHAVHERILTAKIHEGNLIGQSQPLVLPIQLTLHPTEKESLQEIREVLLSLGFLFSLQNSMLEVQAIPPLFDRSSATTFLKQSLSRQQEDIRKLWISMACKAAIKSGERLAPNEAAELITQWIHTEEREYCPHGRPCVLIWTINDLDKLFKRKG